MKNAIIAAMLKKFQMDLAGAGEGGVKLGKFKFREGTKCFALEGLEANWDFKELSFKMTDGNITGAGQGNFKMTIVKLTVTSEEDDGEMVLEDLELNSVDDVKNMLVLLPINQMARLADLRDEARQ